VTRQGRGDLLKVTRAPKFYVGMLIYCYTSA
jgi:hypothetical protein